MLEWMPVGFIHGVMNTDNMSILGLTIDYGPYGWLDVYDPSWTPNTTDAKGRRYSYSNQPSIGLWNCAQLGQCLSLIIKDTSELNSALENYKTIFDTEFLAMMSKKLGITLTSSAEDVNFLNETDRLLQLVETDPTIFYRKLADLLPADSLNDNLKKLMPAFYSEDLTESEKEEWLKWIKAYLSKINDPDRKIKMNSINPKYLPRNYLVHQIIQAADGGDSAQIVKFLIF